MDECGKSPVSFEGKDGAQLNTREQLEVAWLSWPAAAFWLSCPSGWQVCASGEHKCLPYKGEEWLLTEITTHCIIQMTIVNRYLKRTNSCAHQLAVSLAG
ncbi:hypothetical protein Anapl_06919 [Anas platyrhynchos]|uniref:Uncharacterized protein n=1 Tax=Anas platyrhynchos TaxID=8839 RepID=R0K719_ANAPL|nr:hypothetical protein Anapl_06919 [Anas platyrhynchos]